MPYRLVIGNKNYSSWSLRAWLFLKESAIPFTETRIPMFTPDWAREIARYTPARRVPVLIDGDVSVWDTTAIFQYIRERHPDAVGWPKDEKARAHAQSISGEMHSGFLAIRDQLPQNIRARRRRDASELSSGCLAQIRRVDEIWSECRNRYGQSGDWLFGEFCLADVMYTPVALRFATYGIPISDSAQEFQRAVSARPAVREWIAAATAEPEAIAFIDDFVPAAKSPLTLG
jgi:glutathione S-transferase